MRLQPHLILNIRAQACTNPTPRISALESAPSSPSYFREFPMVLTYVCSWRSLSVSSINSSLFASLLSLLCIEHCNGVGGTIKKTIKSWSSESLQSTKGDRWTHNHAQEYQGALRSMDESVVLGEALDRSGRCHLVVREVRGLSSEGLTIEMVSEKRVTANQRKGERTFQEEVAVWGVEQ